MSGDIQTTIDQFRSAGDLKEAQEALQRLDRLLEDLTLDEEHSEALLDELQEVGDWIRTLKEGANAASANLEKFRDETGFFARAVGEGRREHKELKEILEGRRGELGRGHALEASLTLLIDESAEDPSDRPGGLRAAEWKTRVEEAAGVGSDELGAVLRALRDESVGDEELYGRLKEALRDHASEIRDEGLGKLLRRLRKQVREGARDVDLQEALYDDGLVTLRALVIRELGDGDPQFGERERLIEWLDAAVVVVEGVVKGIKAGEAWTGKLISAIAASEVADRELGAAKARVSRLKRPLTRRGPRRAPVKLTEAQQAQLQAAEQAVATAQATATQRKAAMDRCRGKLAAALKALDKALVVYHEHAYSWRDSIVLEASPVGVFPEGDIGDRVGLAGAPGGLLLSTLDLAKTATTDDLEDLKVLCQWLATEIQVVAVGAAGLVTELREAVQKAIGDRMADLVGLPPVEPEGD